MFYVSSCSQGKVGSYDSQIGVTDTEDGVEEFYSQSFLETLVKEKGIQISGFVHTGSGWKVRYKTSDIVKLESLSRGDCFTLSLEGMSPMCVMYLGETGQCNWSYMCADGSTHVLTRKFLLKYKDCVSLGKVSEFERSSLVKAVKKNFPSQAINMGL